MSPKSKNNCSKTNELSGLACEVRDGDVTLKGKLSWSETDIIGVDNQIELKKLCGFKKKVSQKIE